jgi:hypothetical protein
MLQLLGVKDVVLQYEKAVALSPFISKSSGK